jgi:hypothetical protein
MSPLAQSLRSERSSSPPELRKPVFQFCRSAPVSGVKAGPSKSGHSVPESSCLAVAAFGQCSLVATDAGGSLK